MAERLFVVRLASSAKDGVEVLPAVPSDRLPPSPFEVTLRLPDGSERRVTATALLAHIKGPQPPMALVRLLDVAAEEVPPGTEVWTGA
jgi:hypothetical protein